MCAKRLFQPRRFLALKAVDETGLHDEFSGPQRIRVELTIPPARRDAGKDKAPAELVGYRFGDRPVHVIADAAAARLGVEQHRILDGSLRNKLKRSGHSMLPVLRNALETVFKHSRSSQL